MGILHRIYSSFCTMSVENWQQRSMQAWIESALSTLCLSRACAMWVCCTPTSVSRNFNMHWEAAMQCSWFYLHGWSVCILMNFMYGQRWIAEPGLCMRFACVNLKQRKLSSSLQFKSMMQDFLLLWRWLLLQEHDTRLDCLCVCGVTHCWHISSCACICDCLACIRPHDFHVFTSNMTTSHCVFTIYSDVIHLSLNS